MKGHGLVWLCRPYAVDIPDRSVSFRVGSRLIPNGKRSLIPVGETGKFVAGAEGATAPESLRQMDRRRRALWKAGEEFDRFTEGVSRKRR